MDNEKKIAVAYTVTRYEDGSVDVKDNGLEGTTTLDTEGIFKDISEVSDLIKYKRIENAAYVGAYNGTAKFYQDVQKQRDAEEAPKEAE